MPLVSLREVADDFNAGKCQLRTYIELRIGDNVTHWELTLDTEWVVYGPDGRPQYDARMRRIGISSGEGEPPPEELWGQGPRDADVITTVFGIDPDAHVWVKGSMYAKD